VDDFVTDHSLLEDSPRKRPCKPSQTFADLISDAGLEHYELDKILSQPFDSGAAATEDEDRHDAKYRKLMEEIQSMTCSEGARHIREVEAGDRYLAERVVKRVVAQVEWFVNKRRNIFTALKIDSEDKRNIQSFNQNFFITQPDGVDYSYLGSTEDQLETEIAEEIEDIISPDQLADVVLDSIG
jgi:hypothetical protein